MQDRVAQIIQQMDNFDSWDELKEWMIYRGFAFPNDERFRYRHMNAPIYELIEDGYCTKITFVWGREPGFEWDVAPVIPGFEDSGQKIGWLYSTEPLVGDIQLLIRCNYLPYREDRELFMGWKNYE